MSHLHSLLSHHKIISDQVDAQELSVIITTVEKRLSEQAGVIVEFGCYQGTTSLFLERLRAKLAPLHPLHVYDSFLGLPAKTAPDISPVGEQFKIGELLATKRQLADNFKKAGLKQPVIHGGWFSDLQSEDIPSNIAVAFLDGDYYESIMTPLKLIWPQLQPGAIVIVDDYQNEALPGASRAVDEWLKNHQAALKIEASLAILTLPK